MSVSGHLTLVSGTEVPFPEGVAPETTLQEFSELLGLDEEEQLLCCWSAVFGNAPGEPVMLTGTNAVSTLPGYVSEQQRLDATLVKAPKKVVLPLQRIGALTAPKANVTDLKVDFAAADDDLAPMVEKFPSLQKLELACFQNLPQMSKPAAFWGALGDLKELEVLSIQGHHSFRSAGEFKNQVFDAMMAWGAEGPKLKEFHLCGAMSLNLAKFEEFVDTNQVLSPDLRKLTVEYWFANPPQINTHILQKITKRYRNLELLKVGSCCHSVTDEAFKYFRDNDEGIQAGLQLEHLSLTCITTVDGQNWLTVDKVERNLPKLKSIFVGAGRQFCGCGSAQCGASVALIDALKAECGLTFRQSAPHW